VVSLGSSWLCRPLRTLTMTWCPVEGGSSEWDNVGWIWDHGITES